MKEFIGGVVAFFLIGIVTPPMIIAAMCSFYHMDISLMNPANWDTGARLVAILWAGVITLTVIDGQSSSNFEEDFYD